MLTAASEHHQCFTVQSACVHHSAEHWALTQIEFLVCMHAKCDLVIRQERNTPSASSHNLELHLTYFVKLILDIHLNV